MQLTPEQIQQPLTELNAGDALIAIQIISRMLQAGAIRENEMATVGVFRNRLTEALQRATGVNYDEVVLAEVQAQQRAQQASAPGPRIPAPQESVPPQEVAPPQGRARVRRTGV